MGFQENISLRTFNTFGIDVKARYYATFESSEELIQLLRHPLVQSGPMLVLGGGSNMLFLNDYQGVVLHNKLKGVQINEENSEEVLVKAAAGEIWHEFVLHTVAKGWGGIENLSLIPGCVGASPVQNIGAYGVEIKDVFHSLTAIEISSGKERVFTNEECEFGYRNSVFKNQFKGQYIITSVSFVLKKHPKVNISYGAITSVLSDMGIQNPTIQDLSNAVISIRSSKLPDPAVIGNAGSFFKNPEITEDAFLELVKAYPSIPKFPGASGGIKVPAGWLIEQCGWKGKSFGEFGVHKDQALVLVNYGNAKGSEIWDLAQQVIKSVKDKFLIDLEPEVNVIS
jgi:UDP-N-acetylmuramate dehydrogenase